MIEGATIALTCLFIGYWLGSPNKVTTAVKRQILGRQAKIISMEDPLEVNLGENEEI